MAKIELTDIEQGMIRKALLNEMHRILSHKIEAREAGKKRSEQVYEQIRPQYQALYEKFSELYEEGV